MAENGKITAPIIRAMKAKGQKVVCITAYDFPGGAIADASGADLVLVGDSLGNVVLGFETTLPVSLDDMIRHTSAVSKGVERALLVADMPFGSYQSSVAQAVDSAVALMKSGAEAVKLEGVYCDEIRAIVRAGIPVMGHLGMTPQSVHQFGGFKIQGKGTAGQTVIEQAKALEDAGVFSIVLELVPSELAKNVSREVGCPTIGIGAGPFCDGQIQVFHDVLGLGDFQPKHTKLYVDGRQILTAALSTYTREVREGIFPPDQKV